MSKIKWSTLQVIPHGRGTIKSYKIKLSLIFTIGIIFTLLFVVGYAASYFLWENTIQLHEEIDTLNVYKEENEVLKEQVNQLNSDLSQLYNEVGQLQDIIKNIEELEKEVKELEASGESPTAIREQIGIEVQKAIRISSLNNYVTNSQTKNQPESMTLSQANNHSLSNSQSVSMSETLSNKQMEDLHVSSKTTEQSTNSMATELMIQDKIQPPNGQLDFSSIEHSLFASSPDTKQLSITINQLQNDANNQKNELIQLKEDLEEEQYLALFIPSIRPAGGRITSTFGWRKDPFYGVSRMHEGIDFADYYKAPIHASAQGTVEFAGRNGGYGKHIRINHGNGFKTTYSHLSLIEVKRGDVVEKGDLIGKMGSTGRSTGVHLHYEILKNGSPINPLKYIN